MLYEKQRIAKPETKATVNENQTNPINSLSSYYVTFGKTRVKPITQIKQTSFLSIRFGVSNIVVFTFTPDFSNPHRVAPISIP